MEYKLRIAVCESNGTEKTMVTGKLMRIPERISRLLFGKPSTVLVLNSAQSIRTVEIQEIREEA